MRKLFQAAQGGVNKALVYTDESESGMNYQTLFDLNYAYRLMTESVFDAKVAPGGQKPVVFFDLYMADSDPKLKHFNVHENIWRETILVHHISKTLQNIAPIIDFGQLPGNMIYR